MRTKDLRTLSEAELTAKEAELRKSLMKLYGQVSTGTPPKNPGEIRQGKRTLAQILTLKHERARSKTVARPAAPANASVAKRPEARPKA
ncbi:50S ribosomal protein L29 [Candidatus Woesearchaeota archaeon]|nr:50S ribosomal protein L29 [Candidatus Woesearchaeota archaeon]